MKTQRTQNNHTNSDLSLSAILRCDTVFFFPLLLNLGNQQCSFSKVIFEKNWVSELPSAFKNVTLYLQNCLVLWAFSYRWTGKRTSGLTLMPNTQVTSIQISQHGLVKCSNTKQTDHFQTAKINFDSRISHASSCISIPEERPNIGPLKLLNSEMSVRP